MPTIIGIDPGSRFTGFGIVRFENNQYHHVKSGVVSVAPLSIPDRLKTIYQQLSEVVAEFNPEQAAIEQIFMHENPAGALKLGQARGAAIVALASAHLPVSEYSARQIKQAVVGYGAAEKAQVQHMVKRLLNLSEQPQSDAADALAVAICHAQHGNSLEKTGGITLRHRTRRRR